MRQHAVTSWAMLTQRDPWVNILRIHRGLLRGRRWVARMRSPCCRSTMPSVCPTRSPAASPATRKPYSSTSEHRPRRRPRRRFVVHRIAHRRLRPCRMALVPADRSGRRVRQGARIGTRRRADLAADRAPARQAPATSQSGDTHHRRHRVPRHRRGPLQPAAGRRSRAVERAPRRSKRSATAAMRDGRPPAIFLANIGPQRRTAPARVSPGTSSRSAASDAPGSEWPDVAALTAAWRASGAHTSSCVRPTSSMQARYARGRSTASCWRQAALSGRQPR